MAPQQHGQIQSRGRNTTAQIPDHVFLVPTEGCCGRASESSGGAHTAGVGVRRSCCRPAGFKHEQHKRPKRYRCKSCSLGDAEEVWLRVSVYVHTGPL